MSRLTGIMAVALAALAALGTGVAQEEPPHLFVPELAREAAAEGNRAFAAGDHDTARLAYGKVLEIVPGNLLALVNLGMVEFAAGRPAEAEKHLRHALSLQLDNAAAWLTLGTLYMEQGKLDAALAALAQSAVSDPTNPRTRNYLGVVLGRKGWLDAAQDELRKAVEIDPSYSDAHYNLAFFYLDRDPPLVELARRHYYRSVELGAPRDAELERQLTPSAPADTQ